MKEKERKYLVCLKSTYNDGEDDSWDIFTDRDSAYNYIRDYIEYYGTNTDFDESFIVLTSDAVNKSKSLVEFMDYCRDRFYHDDLFDIGNYINNDIYEESTISSEFDNIDNSITKDIINGDAIPYNN